MVKIEKKKLQLFLISSFLLFCVLAGTSHADILFKDLPHLNFTVYPEPVPYSGGGSDWQYFEICSKAATDKLLFVAFIFDEKLESSAAEVNSDYEGYIDEIYKENVTKSKTEEIASYNSMTILPPRCDVGIVHELNKKYFNYTTPSNATVSYACINVTDNLGGGVYNVTWYEEYTFSIPTLVNKTGFNDIKERFKHYEFTGTFHDVEYTDAHAYVANKTFEPNECTLFRVKYKVSPDEPDTKWDLAAWHSPTNDFTCWKTDTCTFEGLLDPTWDASNWDYHNNYTLSVSNSAHNLESVIIQFDENEVNTSCFIAGYDRWNYIDPNDATNLTELNFHYSYQSANNWTVVLNMTRPDTPVLDLTQIRHDFCNNVPVANKTNGNETYYHFRGFEAGYTFPDSMYQLSSGRAVANATTGYLDVGSTTVGTAFNSSQIFGQNTTILSSYKGVTAPSSTCYGYQENTGCGGGLHTMYYLDTNLNTAKAFAENIAVDNVFTLPTTLNNTFVTYIIRRNGSTNAIFAHDTNLTDKASLYTSTNLRMFLYLSSGGISAGGEGHIDFIAVANTSANINWSSTGIVNNLPAVSTNTFTISPTDATTYNTSSILYNITANGTFNSYTCNWTRNGIESSSNFTVVDNDFYSDNWLLTIGNYTLSTTCSNNTTSDTDTIEFKVNSTYIISLYAPPDSSTFLNKSINFNYSVNHSEIANLTVQLFLDDVSIYTDIILSNTTFFKNYNATYYGTHNWYVFVHLTTDTTSNVTSPIFSFDLQFNTTATVLSPLNDTTLRNKTLTLNYSVNITAEENTTVQLFFDGNPIFNDTITSYTLFSKQYTTSYYGEHSWYVFAYLTANQSFNDTSENWTLAIDFDVEAINPADGLNLSAIDVLFSYNVSTLHSLNCSIVLNGEYRDNRTLSSSQTVNEPISLDEGAYEYLISCTDNLDITYQKNTTNRTFYVSFTALSSTINLTSFPQNVYASPQTLFFDMSGELYLLYFSNNASVDYLNLLRLTLSPTSVEKHFYQAMNRTLDFFVAMREPSQTVLMTFNNDSTLLHYFNITNNTLAISNLSTTYNDTMSNSISDPYTYAYTKQFESLDFVDDSYYLFILPLTNGSVLIKKNVGNQSLQQVASANDSRRVVWQTIANNSQLTDWTYAFPKTCDDGNHSITLYSFNGDNSSEIATPDGNCYNQSEIENASVIFESYDNKTYALISNITNFTTLYLIEENKLLNFTYTVTDPSHFFFIDKYTFVFFSKESTNTIAYSCYFENTPSCTRFTSNEYGVIVPYDRGQLVSAKRENHDDVVVKGAITSSGNNTQLSYNYNLYDVKILCYDEVDEYRKTFKIKILTNTSSTVLKNNSWGYVLPSAIFGAGTRFAYTTCFNGTQRLYLIGLTGNFTQYGFSLDSTAGQYYTFRVINEYGLPLPEAVISAYTFSDLFSAQMVVEQGLTDFAGYATLFLKPFDPYVITISAAGYSPATFPYTPTTITAIEVQLSPNVTSQLNMPDYQVVFQDITWSLSFNASPASFATFFTSAFNGTFQLLSNTSKLEYFGMNVYYNNSLIYTQNITSQSTGGVLQYEATLPGQYRFEVWFKHETYPEYRPLVRTIYLGSAIGLAGVSEILKTDEPISGWGYYFIACVIAMLAGGFAARYTLEGAGFVFLAVLWVFTLLYPIAIITCLFGGTCLTTFSATVITTAAVGAVFLVKQYV